MIPDDFRAKLIEQGVSVTPNTEIGGFNLVGAWGQIGSGWFASEGAAWAYAAALCAIRQQKNKT